eukprot:3552526-Amphidinium_carterae.1
MSSSGRGALDALVLMSPSFSFLSPGHSTRSCRCLALQSPGSKRNRKVLAHTPLPISSKACAHSVCYVDYNNWRDGCCCAGSPCQGCSPSHLNRYF